MTFSVYYRLYTEDGPIESVNPVYTDDSYLGRIVPKLVAPPHTALALKHCLLNVENIDNSTDAKLFVTTSSQAPMDDAGSLSILAQPGLGSTPTEPLALVATFSDRGPLDAGTVNQRRSLPGHKKAQRLSKRNIVSAVMKLSILLVVGLICCSSVLPSI
jgi:hypothetical protein